MTAAVLSEKDKGARARGDGRTKREGFLSVGHAKVVGSSI